MNVTGWWRGPEGLAYAAMESFPASANGAGHLTVGLLVSDALPVPQRGRAVRNTRSAPSIAAGDSGRRG